MGQHYHDGYYKGQVDSDSQPHGYGDFEFYNGKVYKGEWKHGVVHGYGTLILQDGTKYTGDFRDGLFDGEGAITYASGNRYSGEWENDKIQGYGTYTWNNGDTYTGSFYNGQPDGKGIIKLTSGESYEGGWKNGNKHGNGKVRYPDGLVISGEWYCGELVKETGRGWVSSGSGYASGSSSGSTAAHKSKPSPEENRRRLARIKEKKKTVIPLCLLGMIAAVALDIVAVYVFKDSSFWWRIILLPVISCGLLGGMNIILAAQCDKGYISGDGALSWIWRITGVIWGIVRCVSMIGAHFSAASGWGLLGAIFTFLFVLGFNAMGPCLMTFVKWED